MARTLSNKPRRTSARTGTKTRGRPALSRTRMATKRMGGGRKSSKGGTRC